MQPKKRRLTEAQAEVVCDRRVQAAMRQDRAYLNAENAEAQAEAEKKIEERVIADMQAIYEIPSWGGDNNVHTHD